MTSTVTEHIRAHILAGCMPTPPRSLAELRVSQWSPAFERYMRNRLIVGCFRYGGLDDPTIPKFDHITSAIQRLEKYRADGNQEHLVDAANLALVEFVRPACHHAPHWSPTDDGEHTKLVEAP